jgi:hypothetical protein
VKTKWSVKDVLKVDKKFGTWARRIEKKVLQKTCDRNCLQLLEDPYGLVKNKVRGVKNVTSYAL